MKQHNLRTILLLAIVCLGIPNATLAKDETRPLFSLKNLQGEYGFAFDGVLINFNDGTRTPTSAVGQFEIDREGRVFQLVRTLNIGGQVLQQKAQGRVSLNSNGTGVATFNVGTISSNGSVTPTSTEHFSFVVSEDRRILQFIGTEIRGPNGEDIGLGIVNRGTGRRQKTRR